MRISIVVVLVSLISRAADAGPTTWPEIVCRGTVAVVTVTAIDGDHALFATDGSDRGFRLPCDQRDGLGGYDPEGCFFVPALIRAPKAHLAKGDRFLAELEPPAGAQCATSAAATHLVPLAWLAVLGALI